MQFERNKYTFFFKFLPVKRSEVERVNSESNSKNVLWGREMTCVNNVTPILSKQWVSIFEIVWNYAPLISPKFRTLGSFRAKRKIQDEQGLCYAGCSTRISDK